MIRHQTETSQTMQRVRVGLTGLAVVLLLIGLASAVFNSASREKPVAVVGGPKPDVVAQLSNSVSPSDTAANEPVAELGLTPGTETSAINAADVDDSLRAQQSRAHR
ncbi:hypothetical protein BH09PSE4_BH09PSE4_02530 [soil metagenome]